MTLPTGQELTPYHVIAFNYAEESENRIHADDTAREYGFRGGLVPGVGDYAYMTRPVVEAWGRAWLERGWIEAKFLKPVYHGDRVEARAKASGKDDESLGLELFDSRGQLCAVGSAGRSARREAPDSKDFPLEDLPDFDTRPLASLESLEAGDLLGSLELSTDDLDDLATESEERFRDDFALYRGASSRLLHPGIVPDLGNRLLTTNVRLGPWIHTATDTQHFAALDTDQPISVRGRVKDAYEKRGHEIVELDAGLFGKDGRCFTQFLHTAIIRPRKIVAE